VARAGLVSLVLGAAAARSSARAAAPARVVATDCDKAALKNMKRNVQVVPRPSSAACLPAGTRPVRHAMSTIAHVWST